MVMRRVGTHRLIEEVIEEMDTTIIVKSVTITGDTSRVYACNTLWITEGETHEIDGFDYRVTAISPNEWIDFYSTDATISVDEFDIQLPKFFYGTIRSAATELNEINLGWSKLPMIYLHDPVEETPGNDLSIVDRESDVDLYFMAQNNIERWTNEQHEDLAVVPMRNMVDKFMECLRSGKFALDPNEGYGERIYNRVRWGEEEKSGYNNQIFRENVSGVQLRITIPFLKSFACNC